MYSLTPCVVWPLQDVTWKNFIVQTHTVQNKPPKISKNRARFRNKVGKRRCCLERWICWVCCLCYTNISWNVALQLLSQDSKRCIPLTFPHVLSGRWTVFVVNHWPDVWQLCSICSEIYKYIFVQLTWTLIVIQHGACLILCTLKDVKIKELFIEISK